MTRTLTKAMKLRCVMATGGYRVGAVIEPPANRRAVLLAQRWAGRPFWVPHVEVETETPAPTVITESPLNPLPESKPEPEPDPEPEAPAWRGDRKRKRAT